MPPTPTNQPHKEKLRKKRKLVLFLWLVNAAFCAQAHVLLELGLGWVSWGTGAVVCGVVGACVGVFQGVYISRFGY